jgi:2'-hydroxyisoflavone reductase
MTTRRSFLRGAAALAAAGSAGILTRVGLAEDGKNEQAKRGLRILILGGTGFLGPAVVDAAKARGHALTLFNRGRTEKRIGMIDGVEKFYGNRDPKLRADDTDPESPQGLSQIEEAIKKGAKWDAVVDTSGYYPRITDASASLLAPAAGQYIFVSSVSVYKDNSKPGADEDSEIATMPDPTIENMGPEMQYYGALKALCEQAAEKNFPGRTTNIRPGYIVGPGDPTDRFTFWPVRAMRGGEMVCPGTGDDPVQVIDVRDLAAFIVRCIENKTMGPFNVTGPADELSTRATVEACVRASDGKSTPVWVPYDFLESKSVAIGGETPIFLPSHGEYSGFHRRSIKRALAAGLACRHIQETCGAIAEWWPREVERRERVAKQMVEAARAKGDEKFSVPPADRLRAGWPAEREAEILAAWKEQQK